MLKKLIVVLAWIVLILTFFFILGATAAILKWIDRPIAELVAELSVLSLLGVVALLLFSFSLEIVIDDHNERKQKDGETKHEKNQAMGELNEKIYQLEETTANAMSKANSSSPDENTLEYLKHSLKQLSEVDISSAAKKKIAEPLREKFHLDKQAYIDQVKQAFDRIKNSVEDDSTRKRKSKNLDIERRLLEEINSLKKSCDQEISTKSDQEDRLQRGLDKIRQKIEKSKVSLEADSQLEKAIMNIEELIKRIKKTKLVPTSTKPSGGAGKPGPGPLVLDESGESRVLSTDESTGRPDSHIAPGPLNVDEDDVPGPLALN